MHPAWTTFIEAYHPATEHEQPEYLTTVQVMDRLNSIIDYEFPNQAELVAELRKAGFKYLLPPPGGVFLWMVKDTRMKMVQETSGNADQPAQEPEPLLAPGRPRTVL
jgi:hypothetical protein